MTKEIRAYEKPSDEKGYRSYVQTLGPLWCDLYALTMAQAAYKLGFADEAKSTSHVFCRSLVNNGQTYQDENGQTKPVKMPYLVNAGLGVIGEWLSGWRFAYDDLHYLATLRSPGRDGKSERLFSNEFLNWLEGQSLDLSIDAMPEGELILPQEPALRISGPWWQQQMVEAATLSIFSSSTNQATMAAQVRLAATRAATAEGKTLVEASAKDVERAGLAEMALRRTDSIGGIQATRAAMIAGWDNSSNVYAGKCYGVPVMGTFAHSWVMLHDTEEQAFENWAKAYPNTCVFLADTYDTMEAVKKAVAICKKYNLKLKGIRLDSGDMAYYSNEVDKYLESEGYPNVAILGSDAVNARAAYNLFGRARSEITGQLLSHIGSFGIGSEVAVNQYQPLLSAVMKLASVNLGGKERDVMKFAENRVKSTLPGEIDVLRYLINTANGEKFAGDTIVSKKSKFGDDRLYREVVSVNTETGRKKPFIAGTRFYRPIKPWMREGEWVDPAYRNQDAPAILAAARETFAWSMERLEADHKRIDMPRKYGWGIEEALLNYRNEQIDKRDLARERQKQSTRFGLVS